MKNVVTLLVVSLFLLSCNRENKYYLNVNNEKSLVEISTQNGKMALNVDYSKGCRIADITVNGRDVLSQSGCVTSFKRGAESYTSTLSQQPKVTKGDNEVVIEDIIYGNRDISISEKWTFKVYADSLTWSIDREYLNAGELHDIAIPQWNFKSMDTWKGGIIDNGGMVWCKYLKSANDTYGVHTAGVTFWEPTSGDAMRIDSRSSMGDLLASKFEHNQECEFVYTQYSTKEELKQRYNLSRFVGGHNDVFANQKIEKCKTNIHLTISYVDYNNEYCRGTLPTINEPSLRELLNTTARYGVVDNKIVGANGWLTNWKCMHEPFFSQIAMALNDKNYTDNLASTLDSERDYALLEDGRMLSRWHDVMGDEITGTYDKNTGYYEAMWGYTVDSQTGYVINTVELFDLLGDKDWLLSHKEGCEKALDWLIRRDSDNNGIFEMVNDDHKQGKCSDWIDIVWASYENAFVNAQMYEALILWVSCEEILGDKEMAEKYSRVAARLKESFNKDIKEGGLWNSQKRQYIYWRDKDGSIHGDNLVTPIQFAAIAYCICDDKERITMILDQIESRTTDENLFHWPLCFDPYNEDEVHENNLPYPTYENGDIFPTWGCIGIRSYAKYDKKLALKYVRNILDQYEKDGLSSQRYSRREQMGVGEDILSGISTSATALYRDIYGVRPRWNRMGLEPNLVSELNGTKFDYTHKGIKYNIELNENNYKISTSLFSLQTPVAVGVAVKDGCLLVYPFNKDVEPLSIKIDDKKKTNIKAEITDNKEMSLSKL